jgi:2,6-dihydroxypyridine 3-monooxygenase
MAFDRVCILGDAAFSARPHTAAGTAKAAEDTRQLGLALRQCQNDVPAALKLWEEKQLQLGRNLVQRNREAGALLQNGRWPVGAPLLFGLYEEGDSEMQ